MAFILENTIGVKISYLLSVTTSEINLFEFIKWNNVSWFLDFLGASQRNFHGRGLSFCKGIMQP